MSGRRPRDQKISPGRDAYDPRWLIAYCSDFKCSHSVVIDGAQWGDECSLVRSGAEIRFRRQRPRQTAETNFSTMRTVSRLIAKA